MRNFMSFAFDQLTDPLELPLSPLWEWVILGMIGVIAYRLAFASVGDMYSEEMISGRTAGSVLHWILRLVYFVSMWAVVNGVIHVGMWLMANWILIGTILAWGGLVLLFSRLDRKCGKQNA